MRKGGLAFLFAFLIFSPSTVLALDNCTLSTSRYLAYNVDTPSNGPWVYNSFNNVACETRKLHANFGGLAVGQLRVWGSAPFSVACTSMRVRVTNGAFANGPNVEVNRGELKQSLVGGTVLFVLYETLSAFGSAWYNASWANSPNCPV